MEKEKLLTILISAILLLTLINLYGTFNLYGKFDSITGKSTADANKIELNPTNNEPNNAQRVQASADDDPAKGSKSAPVAIVEFSDFQCPYCARFYMQTLPLLDDNYIKTGKVKLVFRDFPLSFHQYAQKASEASECAHEQGKFWEYHDKMFENQQSLSIESLKQFASELSLDTSKFNNCLDSGKMAAEVKKDFEDGQSYGVSGTPAFFINGIPLVGAQPFEAFKQIIDKELGK